MYTLYKHKYKRIYLVCANRGLVSASANRGLVESGLSGLGFF
jgi:hypothetical protein